MSRLKKNKRRNAPSSHKVRTGKTRKDRLAKIHYALLIGSILLFVLHYIFFEEKILGHDMRYTLYVFWGPTLLGCLALAIYQWQPIREVFQELKTVKDYVIAISLLPLLGLLISYLSLGSLANISFTYLNRREAKQHVPQVFHCQVKRFNDGKYNTINFEFNKRSESFHVSDRYIKLYSSANPNEYELEIVAQKGIWDYYVVKDWNIKKQ